MANPFAALALTSPDGGADSSDSDSEYAISSSDEDGSELSADGGSAPPPEAVTQFGGMYGMPSASVTLCPPGAAIGTGGVTALDGLPSASVALWPAEPDGGTLATLVRTSSTELARQRSGEERSRRAAALTALSVAERDDEEATSQLAAVKREVAAMRSMRVGGSLAHRSPGRTASENPSPTAARRIPSRSMSTGRLSLHPRGGSRRTRSVVFRAVTVEWLVAFTDKHDAWHMKTYEVVEHIIKPLTAARRCRFSELEDEVPEGVLGAVDSFLSHCWGNEFGDLVAAAGHNARFGRRYWVDIFAVNQHMSSSSDKKEVKQWKNSSGKVVANQPVARSVSGILIPQFEDDLARLNDVVRAASQGTTLVLCPRKAMGDKYRNPMRRVWCVEEIRETLDANQPLIIKSGAAIADERTGVHMFKEEWDKAVTQELVLSVDVEQAEASVASDRAMILVRLC